MWRMGGTTFAPLRIRNFFTGGEKAMNALELLKQDHENVKRLFREAEAAQDGKRRKELFDQIETELVLDLTQHCLARSVASGIPAGGKGDHPFA